MAAAGGPRGGRPPPTSRFQVKIGDEWKDSEASEDKLLKQLLLDGHETVKITLRGQRLEYDFRVLEQRNISRGTVRPIRLPKEWVDDRMEDWVEDRRAVLAQPGGPRSGAAAPPPTPRPSSQVAGFPSAAAARASSPAPPAPPPTPPPLTPTSELSEELPADEKLAERCEEAPAKPAAERREASRCRARSPSEAAQEAPRPREASWRRPPSVLRGRRQVRENSLAAAGAAEAPEEPRRHPSAGPAPAAAARKPARAASLVEGRSGPEAPDRRCSREASLAARVAELEAELVHKDREREEALRKASEASEHFLQEVIRSTRENGERFAAVSLKRLASLATRTQRIEDQLGGRRSCGRRQGKRPSPEAPPQAAPQAPPPQPAEGRGPGAQVAVPAIAGLRGAEQDAADSDGQAPTQRHSAAAQDAADSDGQAPTQRHSAAAQAGLLSRVLALEAQLAASRAQNGQLREALAAAREEAAAPRKAERELGSPRHLQLEVAPQSGSPVASGCAPLWEEGPAEEVAPAAGRPLAACRCSCCAAPGLAPKVPGHLCRRLCPPAWRGDYLCLLPGEVADGDDDEEEADPSSLDGTPAPPSGESWDWPLSRLERRERAAFLDRQLLMADQRSLMEHVAGARGGCAQLDLEAATLLPPSCSPWSPR